MPRRTKPPSYRHHKPSGQAIVTLSGKTFYLGRFGSSPSKRKYDLLIAEWLASDRTTPDVCPEQDMLVGQLSLRYWEFAQGYYRKDGRSTSELSCIKSALRFLNDLYADSRAAEFGPLAIKTVRDRMIQHGLSRNTINGFVNRIKRTFRWAAEHELLPQGVYHALTTVVGLRRGRSEARETMPVLPVPETDVRAIKEFVSPQIWAMVQLQLVTGMRSGEVTTLRGKELDRTGQVWSYSPVTHKTIHRGRSRRIFLGPLAQKIIRPFLRLDPVAYLFSPGDAEIARNLQRRENRQTPAWPSHSPKLRRARALGCREAKHPPGDRYTPDSYRKAIARACHRAGVPRWNPHRLRHNAATAIRKEYSLEAARAMLGHRTVGITQHYAELDEALAQKVAAEAG